MPEPIYRPPDADAATGMKAYRILAYLTLLAWACFAATGYSAAADMSARLGPDFPSAEQRSYYLHFPLMMSGVSLMVLVASFARRLALAAGLASLLLLLVLAGYAMGYTGGV